MTTTLLLAMSLMSPALTRWSAVRAAPLSRSRAWPWAMSLLASIRQRWLPTPPHCSAKAVMLPTSPPPPTMLTFMVVSPLLPSRKRLRRRAGGFALRGGPGGGLAVLAVGRRRACRRGLRRLLLLQLLALPGEDAHPHQHRHDGQHPPRPPDDLQGQDQRAVVLAPVADDPQQ